MPYINQYSTGSREVTHKGKKLQILDTKNFYNYMKSLEFGEFQVVYIPAGFEHRPDLISNFFYGTVTKDWVIMAFNNIKDPHQELNVGDRLLIPKT